MCEAERVLAEVRRIIDMAYPRYTHDPDEGGLMQAAICREEDAQRYERIQELLGTAHRGVGRRENGAPIGLDWIAP